MVYWLLVGPPDNWEIGLERGLWGLPESQEKSWGRVCPGDTVFFYATAPVKGVFGYASVEATRRDSSLVWPQEVKEGRALWPLRIEFERGVLLARTKWQNQRVLLGRRGLQRALQRLDDERASKLRGELDMAALG